jgi:hypothetical protein
MNEKERRRKDKEIIEVKRVKRLRSGAKKREKVPYVQVNLRIYPGREKYAFGTVYSELETFLRHGMTWYG